MRKGAGTSHEVVAKLKNGAKVKVTGESGSWYKIDYDGKAGYVSKSYIVKVTEDKPADTDDEDAKTTKGYITASALNVGDHFVLGNYEQDKTEWNESIYDSVAILLQGIYGIFSLVGPTSLILIFGLSYFDVPYTTWLKYIWRFILGLIIVLALVTCLVVLL